MVNCPSCGAPVDLHLEHCPYCGCIIPKEKNLVEQNEPQVIIQQVVQEVPYVKRREKERLEAEYKKKKTREICRIIAGGILVLICIPFFSSERNWPIYFFVIGAGVIFFGLQNYKKYQKEFEQKIK